MMDDDGDDDDGGWRVVTGWLSLAVAKLKSTGRPGSGRRRTRKRNDFKPSSESVL